MEADTSLYCSPVGEAHRQSKFRNMFYLSSGEPTWVDPIEFQIFLFLSFGHFRDK